MMNENSPICAIEKPQRMADFRLWPLIKKPKVPNTAWPNKMVSTKAIIGQAYETMILRSTSMPTDTKKMAPKRFFTGSTRRMMRSASTVSAKIDPITKAPKALLKPTLVDSTAIKQHRPNETMSNVSPFINLRIERRNNGTKKMPTTNHSTRKKAIFNTEPNI